jgi:hypothetical protein
MIRPSLSMVTYQRLSPRILPLLLEASSHWPTIKMQTCTMTLLQVTPSLVFYTSWTRCLSTGTLRNKPPSKWQHTGANSFRLKPALIRLLIYISP